MKEIKTYVLDTNVILHDAEAIFKFDEHNVLIPITVIEEIDNKKKDKSELGANARAFARYVDNLRSIGDLRAGVKVNDQGGKLYITIYDQTVQNCLPYQDMSIMDNRILASVIHAKTYLNIKNSETIFVTKDINLRIRADIFGIKAEDYKNGKVESIDLYNGHQDIFVSPEIINTIYTDKKLDKSLINVDAYPNECFTFIDETNIKHSALVRYDSILQQFNLLPQDLKTSGIIPRNSEQSFAIDMLCDKNLNLCSLIGKAGSGKTMISLAAGLRGVLDLQEYTRILLLKPIVPMDNGHELGFLPGSMEEKLAPWMASYVDNIELIMSEYFKEDEPKKKTKKNTYDEKSAGKINPVQELINLGLLELGSLEHLRGRSLPNQFIIIDEAQNCSPHALKTIITRVGEGSKIVLLGDISQIDTPYLDARSNGLSIIVEAFKDQTIAGHIILKKSERSKLAEIASEIL